MTNSEHHNLTRNTVWLLSSEIASRLLAFWIVVQLANTIGAREYGELSYAFAVANLLVPIADFGLTTYLVRTLSRHRETTSSLVSMLIVLKCFLGAITLGIMLLTGLLLRNIPLGLLLAGGAAIILTNMRMFLEGVFRAHQRMHLEALSKMVGVVLLIITLGVLLWTQSSLTTIAIGYAAAAFLSVLITIIIIGMRITPLQSTSVWSTTYVTTLRASVPFATAIAFNMVLNYADSVMLGAWGHTQEVGWYNAAYKPIFFLTALAGMVVGAFFPIIANEFHHARVRVEQTVHRLLQTNMIIALPMAVGGTLLAPDIMGWLYSDAYQPATLAFQILLWSTLCIYCWSSFGNSLQACDRERTYLHGFAIAAGMNIVLNIVLIPRWSLYGAAIATLVTQLFLAWFMAWNFRAIAVVPLYTTIWRPCVAALAMGVVVRMLTPLFPLLFNIIAGIIIYGCVLFVIGGIKKQELRRACSLWKRNL